MPSRKRHTELALLVVVFIILTAGWLQVVLTKTVFRTWDTIIPNSYWLFIYGLLFLIVHICVRVFAEHADPILLPTAMFLNGIGLLFLHRIDISRVDNALAKLQRSTDLQPKERVQLETIVNADLGGRQLKYVLVSIIVFIVLLALIDRFDLRVQCQERYKRFIRIPLVKSATGWIPNFEKIQWWWMLCFLSLGFLILPSIIPGRTKEITLSFQVAGISIQASEFSKIGLLLFVALYLSNRPTTQIIITSRWATVKDLPFKSILQFAFVGASALLILVLQRDLGPTLLIYGFFFAIFYMATGLKRWLVLGLSLSAFLMYMAWNLIPIVRERADFWLHPWTATSDSVNQLQQSVIAIGSGGVFGVGIGNGSPGYIPLSFSDFIFAAIAEEIGFVGVIALLLVYLLFISRGFAIALRSRDDFHRLVTSGIAFLIGLQTFIIIGGVSGLIPLTGITLPFISAGGSSLLATYILLAILIGLSSIVEKTHYQLTQTAMGTPAPGGYR